MPRRRASFAIIHLVRRAVFPAAGLLMAGLLPAAQRESRPNIILIVADDMGYSDIGCFGSEISTPHLDSLAARGVRFTHFYNNSVCCPTRASLLTGLYPHQAGVGWMVLNGSDSRPEGPYQGFLNQHCVTLGEVLATAGYRTYMSGKWHVGENRPHWPVDRGFNRSFALISGAANYFDLNKDYVPSVHRQLALDGASFEPAKSGFYLTDAIADYAVEFLAEAGVDEKPFFLYLPFTAPHSPLHALPGDIAANRGKYRAGWDAIRQARFDRMKAMGLVGKDVALSPRDPELPTWSETREPDLEDLKMAVYAGQVQSMDRAIGRVLAALHNIGREQQTWIIFFSDNGAGGSDLTALRSAIPLERSRELNLPPYLGGVDSYQSYGKAWANVSNTPYRKYKFTFYEGGIITPLIVAGPGVTGPAISDEPGHVMDLLPTLVELAGATYPLRFAGRDIPPVEGISLAPIWRGQSRPAHRPSPLCWSFEAGRAIRDGNWKLVGAEDKPWELYDLSHDPTELHDLAPANSTRVQEMANRYAAWAQSCGVQPWSRISTAMVNLPGVK